jgi:large subunit ribosomal protein L35Ae
MIIEVDGYNSADDAKDLVGKDVSYNTGKKTIDGEVSATHGDNGAVRAIFETGMPGQSLGQPVSIE